MPNLRMNNTERETPVDRVVRGGLSEEASFTLRPAVRSAGEACSREKKQCLSGTGKNLMCSRVHNQARRLKRSAWAAWGKGEREGEWGSCEFLQDFVNGLVLECHGQPTKGLRKKRHCIINILRHPSGIRTDMWTNEIERKLWNWPLHAWSAQQGCQAIQWGKDGLFNRWCWENWITICKRRKRDPYPPSYMKMDSKWIKDINVKAKTEKLLEDDTGGKLRDSGFSNDFLHMTPKYRQRTKKRDELKSKNFCAAKDPVDRVKRQPT